MKQKKLPIKIDGRRCLYAKTAERHLLGRPTPQKNYAKIKVRVPYRATNKKEIGSMSRALPEANRGENRTNNLVEEDF